MKYEAEIVIVHSGKSKVCRSAARNMNLKGHIFLATDKIIRNKSSIREFNKKVHSITKFNTCMAFYTSKYIENWSPNDKIPIETEQKRGNYTRMCSRERIGTTNLCCCSQDFFPKS